MVALLFKVGHFCSKEYFCTGEKQLNCNRRQRRQLKSFFSYQNSMILVQLPPSLCPLLRHWSTIISAWWFQTSISKLGKKFKNQLKKT